MRPDAEAVFNLLGPAIRGMRMYDLFAGTGAMAVEAAQPRGGRRVLVERHIPTKVIRENIATLGLLENYVKSLRRMFSPVRQSAGRGGNVAGVLLPALRLFSSIAGLGHAPGHLLGCRAGAAAIVVESDDRFDHRELPETGNTDGRQYPQRW